MQRLRYFAGGFFMGVFFGALAGMLYTIFAHSRGHPAPASGATIAHTFDGHTLYIRPWDDLRRNAVFLTIPFIFLSRWLMRTKSVTDVNGTRLVLPEDRPRHFVTFGFWVGTITCFLLLSIDGPVEALGNMLAGLQRQSSW